MIWSKDATERRLISFYPRSDQPVLFTIFGELIFGTKIVGNAFHAQNYQRKKKVVDAQSRWDVHAEECEWERIRLQFSFHENAFDFPESKTAFSCEIICKATRLRFAAMIPSATGEFSIELDKEAVRGDVLITPYLLSADGPIVVSSDSKGVRLAEGFPVHIRIDPPMEKPGSGIEVHWYEFEEQVRDALYQLSIEPPDVLLRINSRHPALKTVIQDQAKSGNRAKIRNAVFSLIASDVWYQLASFAAEVESQNIEDPDDPYAQLSHQLLKALSRMLKCRVEEILEDFQDGSGRASINARIQNHLRAAVHNNAMITGLTSEEDEAEAEG